jgi:hypothetical protein
MSVQRSPPVLGGSQLDLSKAVQSPEVNQINFRSKRKHEHDCRSVDDMKSFRQEITSLFKDFVSSQNKFLNKISDDVSVIRVEVQTLKQTMQTITTEHDKITDEQISKLSTVKT